MPHLAFAMFQCMFAAITPTLITGAVAERLRFGPFLVFSLAWTILVYNPVRHWVWGNGGWRKELGVLDFAGGIVVHLTCGAEYKVDFVPKVKIELVVEDAVVPALVAAIREAAHTGEVGDGKIFILNMGDAVRIRTGETGGDAISGRALERNKCSFRG